MEFLKKNVTGYIVEHFSFHIASLPQNIFQNKFQDSQEITRYAGFIFTLLRHQLSKQLHFSITLLVPVFILASERKS